MIYCRYCLTRLEDSAIVCRVCGKVTGNGWCPVHFYPYVPSGFLAQRRLQTVHFRLYQFCMRQSDLNDRFCRHCGAHLG